MSKWMRASAIGVFVLWCEFGVYGPGRCTAGQDQPSPITDHQYSCGYNGLDLEMLHDCGVTLLSHFPWSTDMEEMKRYIDKAHRLGIKLLPYVSGEKAWYLDTPDRLRIFNLRLPAAAIPYYQGVDPSAHPEWILVDELGRLVPRYGSYIKNASGEWEVRWGVWHAYGQRYEDLEHPRPWSWYMCSSAEGYLDAVERGVRAVMEMGVDGVFLDNSSKERLPRCHGSKLGKHKHQPPGQNTDKTYVELARRVYQTVKSYGADKIVLLNGGLQEVYTPIRDGGMIESYINVFAKREDPQHWETILKWARQYHQERGHNRFVTALSYLGESERPVKDEGFYTYACAQLSNFKWTATSPRPDIVRLLYRARLVVPQGEMQESSGLWYRVYDRGMVLVNPDRQQEREAWIPSPACLAKPVELYTGKRLAVKNGQMHIQIDRQAGRVIVDLPAAVDHYLAECAATLAGVGKQLAGSAELATTLVGAEMRFLGITDQDLGQLPRLSEGDWQAAGHTVRHWAKRVKPMTQAGPATRSAAKRESVLMLLEEIHRWCRDLPAGNHHVLRCLRAADEHACRAAALLTESK